MTELPQPEFLPTEEIIKFEAPLYSFRKTVARLTAISSPAESSINGEDLLGLSVVPSEDGVSGYLILTTTDGLISNSSQYFEADVQSTQEETVYVPAKTFMDVLRAVTTEDLISISVIGLELSVRTDNFMWRVKLPNTSEVSMFQEKSEFEIPLSDPKLFSQDINKVLKAAATGTSRVSLTQLLFSKEAVLACDGLRLHKKKISYLGDHEFTIPVMGIEAFLRLIKDSEPEKAALAVGKSTISLYTDYERVTVRKYMVAFPDVEKVFITQSVMNDNAFILDKTELYTAVKSVKIFADALLSSVRIASVKTSSKTYMVVEAKDEIGNTSKTTVKVLNEVKGSLNINLNFKHIMNVLESMSSEFVIIRTAKDSKAARTTAFIDDPRDGFTAILGQVLKD